jgi:hypothetical protein
MNVALAQEIEVGQDAEVEEPRGANQSRDRKGAVGL